MANRDVSIAIAPIQSVIDTSPRADRPIRDAATMFLRNGAACLGAMMLLIIVAGSIFGPVLYGVDAFEMVNLPFLPPGPEAPLGTDFLGRDILAGILIGGRATLTVGTVSAVITVTIGLLVGAFAGFYGGSLGRVLMKLTEFFQVLPALLLAMVLVTVFSPSLATVTLAIGVVGWPQVARLTRGEFMRIGGLDYVKAARTAGARDFYLMFRVIMPGAIAPVVVAAALVTGASILFEAGLSFLGLSAPNTMSWGLIIGQNRNYLTEAWWTVACPGIAIFLTVLAISLIGDGINDALNPRLRRR